METPIIIAIILLIVLIAGGIYMLTRNPAPPRSESPPPSDSPAGVDPEVDRYDVGGEHVAAGDAQASTAESPYDQDSDTGHTVYEHDGETHVEPATVDETVSQDTATGTEVEVVEEEPVVRADEDLDPVDAPADPYDHGDQEQVTYGTARTEDYAAETTYAQPVPHEQDLEEDEEPSTDEDTIVVVEEDEEPSTDEDTIVVVEEDEEPSTDEDTIVAAEDQEVPVLEPAESEQSADDDDLNGRTAEEVSGGATVMGKAGHDDVRESDDSDAQTPEHHSGHPHGQVSENPGPEEGEGDVDEHEVDQGHPGPSSQRGGDATYDEPLTHSEGVENPGPEQGEGDQSPPSDQGHPGHDSHPGAEATYDLDDGVTDGAERDDEGQEIEDHEVDELDDAERSQRDDGSRTPVVSPAGALETTQDVDETGKEDTDDHHQVGDDEDNDHLVEDHEQTEEPVATGSDAETHVDTGESGGSHDASLAHATDDGESVPEEGPYGPGSAMPHDDGTGPTGFEVKGNAGSMLFHTPDSPAYEDCRAEVWFDSEDAARQAGFAHWDRKRR